MADGKKQVPNPFTVAGGLDFDLLDVNGAPFAGTEMPPMVMQSLPPQLRIKKDSLHDWSHFIGSAILANMATLMQMTNLPDFLAPEEVRKVTQLEYKCLKDKGMGVRAVAKGENGVDVVLWEVELSFKPE